MKTRAESGAPRLRWTAWLLWGACCVLLPVGAVPPAIAQTDYDLSWWTPDGGGVTLSTGEGYRLSRTADQPDAGVLAGGGYSLDAGQGAGGAARRPTQWRDPDAGVVAAGGGRRAWAVGRQNREK